MPNLSECLISHLLLLHIWFICMTFIINARTEHKSKHAVTVNCVRPQTNFWEIRISCRPKEVILDAKNFLLIKIIYPQGCYIKH